MWGLKNVPEQATMKEAKRFNLNFLIFPLHKPMPKTHSFNQNIVNKIL
jgi:hypothetical protein